MYCIGEFNSQLHGLKPWGPTGGINTMTSERSERVIHPYSIFNILIKYQIYYKLLILQQSEYINQSNIKI